MGVAKRLGGRIWAGHHGLKGSHCVSGTSKRARKMRLALGTPCLLCLSMTERARMFSFAFTFTKGVKGPGKDYNDTLSKCSK